MNPQKFNYFFWQSLLLTTSVVVSINKPLRVVAVPILPTEIPVSNQQLLPQATITKSVAPIREIRSLDQIEHPLTDAQKLVQSPIPIGQLEIISVTGVKVNSIDKGLEVILETGVKSDRLQVTPKTEGKSYVADIPNVQLHLTSGNIFRQEKPAPGIAEVSVTNIDANTLRVTVTGVALAPPVELFDSSEGLVFGVISTTSTAQQPTPPQQKLPSGENQAPIELEVTAPPDTGYNPTNTSVGTRTNTPLRDIPQTINVIPQQVIKDQRILYIGDALKNVGTSTDRFPGSQDRFVIRGFNSSFGNILTDGLRGFSLGGSAALNLNNIERVEVLRGPASVLYGRAGLGGVVNLVTKPPLKDPYYAADFSVGNYNSYRGSLDFSGPLTTNKNVSYRLNASYLNSDSFIDFYNEERYQFAGALSWDIDRNTKLTFNSSYGDYNSSLANEGLPAIGTLYPNPNGKVPISRYIGQVGTTDIITTRLSYKLEHRFNDNWSIENAFGLLNVHYIGNPQGRGVPIALQPDDETLTRRRFVQAGDSFQNGYDLNTLVTGRFKTGSLEHQLVVGTEYGWSFVNGYNQNFTAPSINIFSPVYGQLGNGTLLNQSKNATIADNLGVYAQDLITLSQNLKLVLGGRYDWTGETDYDKLASTSTEFSSEAFSPRVGIVYQPIKPISLYASYARSFIPQTGLSATGQAFQPQRGTQYEVGAKADLLGDKLSVNLALFDLTQSNILTNDPNNSGFAIPVGEANSKGVELFVTGEISPGWNVIASYAYADPRVTEDNSIPVGKELPGAAQNIASFWTTYIIPKGNLKGFGAGLGLYYVGDRFVDSANTVKLPNYVRTDAALFYRQGKFDAALNFQNLFDVNYFEGAFGSTPTDTTVYYGYPFTVNFTLGWHF
ncbi:MAG: TonB-dependent siderophore receptor [Nostoc sp. NMS7]|uniref:TonB-dependent siderophore receptor n=1 Tax=Nostoc sp. NMS7 TaxID=2815391 RepID=UPI0025DEB766|nr:TonB-dependent siderophore receptor [Nostoc sp. NMS7]MBN3947339.1 TonB-dependent siderophore receptor [Nostoc sp. NMS7]